MRVIQGKSEEEIIEEYVKQFHNWTPSQLHHHRGVQ